MFASDISQKSYSKITTDKGDIFLLPITTTSIDIKRMK